MHPTREFPQKVDASEIERFRWQFSSILADTADEVGFAGAAHVSDDGVVTVRNHPIHILSVWEWFFGETEDSKRRQS